MFFQSVVPNRKWADLAKIIVVHVGSSFESVVHFGLVIRNMWCLTCCSVQELCGCFEN